MCWTDSTIALSWIQGGATKKEVFVANRVKEIRELTPPSCWQHCGSKDNPADLITWRLLADKLVNNTLWLYGPSMLIESPCQNKEVNTVVIDLEKKKHRKYSMSQCTKSASNPLV